MNEKLKFNHNQHSFLLECLEKKDIQKWNKYVEKNSRNEQFELRLDGADFGYADLIGVNLSKAYLRNAGLGQKNLREANLSHAHLECANFWYSWAERADLSKANLKHAYLRSATFKDAKLCNANLEDANIILTNLTGADLSNANLSRAVIETTSLKKAIFTNSNLEGVSFRSVDLRGAVFCYSICDNFTKFVNCTVDSKTDFRGVSLETIRFSPGTKNDLDCNHRRLNWYDYYKRHRIFQWPWKIFWGISDYGRSTGRIVICFFGFSLLFASIYALFPNFVDGLEGHTGLMRFLRSVYFSVVTMTTLGFGDIRASSAISNHLSWTSFNIVMGYIFLMLQVLLGYVLLGALITRLSILFNSDGPESKTDKSKKNEAKIQEKMMIKELKLNRKNRKQKEI